MTLLFPQSKSDIMRERWITEYDLKKDRILEKEYLKVKIENAQTRYSAKNWFTIKYIKKTDVQWYLREIDNLIESEAKE